MAVRPFGDAILAARRSLHWTRRRAHSAAVEYHHSNDFCFDALRARAVVPPFSQIADHPEASSSEQEARWEKQYRSHVESPSHLFKERRYLLHAFPSLQEERDLRILEVGCGNGSSTTPILRGNARAHVHATDPSSTAVEITRQTCEREGVADRLTTEVQDEHSPLGGPAHGHFDLALIVFTLSAVPRPGDTALVQRVAAALRPGGAILFRDYGAYDLRMLRDVASASGAQIEPRSKPPGHIHGRTRSKPRPDAPRSTRVGEREFLRPGGMFRRYYAIEDLANVAEVVGGLSVEEARYCCVRVENKRRALTMDRVFLHAVLRRDEG